jgi:colanic acid biosynthesis glycosyl transferase WcaI
VKILYVSQYFPPEMGAPAARAAELAQHWARAGHEVSILTGFPNHPTGVVPSEWCRRFHRLACHENINGVDVFRTWLWPLPNRKAHERIRNYFSFCLSAAVRGLSIPRPDVIIGTSPQLLVALSGWWLAFVKRVPFVFEVRDLWPESLAAVGASSEGSFLHRSVSAVAKFLYRHSDHIVVVTAAFKQHLIEHRHLPEEKISIVENGVEPGLFSALPTAENNAVRRKLHANGKFIVCYIGTLGMAHGLETLLDAAATLQEKRPEVLFLLIGEGSEKERISSVAQSRGLANILFLDQQPREKIPDFISAADACLVLLKKKDVFKTVIPTKLLEFMSCARPVILGVDGQSRQIVEEAKAGLVIEPENSTALVQAITQLANSPDLRKQLGENGREYIVRHFSRQATAETYIRVLADLLGISVTRENAAAAA